MHTHTCVCRPVYIYILGELLETKHERKHEFCSNFSKFKWHLRWNKHNTQKTQGHRRTQVLGCKRNRSECLPVFRSFSPNSFWGRVFNQTKQPENTQCGQNSTEAAVTQNEAIGQTWCAANGIANVYRLRQWRSRQQCVTLLGRSSGGTLSVLW